MAEDSRKSYTPPAIEYRGRITDQALQSIHCSRDATESEQPAEERVLHWRARSAREDE
jgi:hypothetical protein